MVRLPAFDVYLELGLATSADRAQIRAAYRQAAKEAHPDVSDVTGATARMARINASRDVLLDPDRRFGGRRRYRLDPAEHAVGEPLPSAPAARDYARTCSWFAGTSAGGQRPIVLTGWGERAEFPAVGRIRQRDGDALDPEIVAVLAAYADEAAVRDALAYSVAGRVVLLAQYGDRVRSVVCGRHAYAVEVTVGASGTGAPMRASCSRPSWRPYCKHILSTWLVWHYTQER